MRPLLRHWRPVALVLAVVVVVAAVAVLVQRAQQPPPVALRDVGVDVLDGPDHTERVHIDATLYLPEQSPAPAVLLAHGFGGSKDSVADQARELAQRGFVVLTYSARGFGNSTGQIALNALDYEVTDARQLLDWLADQPQVQLDGPGDPRVGVMGASYGGALALSLAGVDRRVDALVPMITWNDLAQALLPNAAAAPDAPLSSTPSPGAFGPEGVFKRSWAGIFFSAGLSPAAGAGPRGEAPEPGQSNRTSTSSTGGAPAAGAGGGLPSNPLELNCGRFRSEVCQAYMEVATTGRASPGALAVLRRASPAAVAGNITAPTMLVQGELDTLFGLDQADATARQIAAGGGTVKVVWYSGGHDGGAPGQRLRDEIISWFDYYLARRGADSGTGFEYAVRGNFQRTGAPSVRTVYTSRYPGLPGRGVPAGPGVERRTLALAGGTQPVLVPPGGSPAALSSVPGLGSLGSTASALAGAAVDLPGQTATFGTDPLTSQLLVAGSPQVRLKIATLPGAPAADAVLFAKLYDVAPDGRPTLPGAAVAPLRVTNLPADGTPVEVTVTLPGIVRPVEPGHRLMLAVSTTDQAYAGPTGPTVQTVALAGDGQLSVPVVPGRSAVDVAVPSTPLIGIGVVLGLVAVVAVVMSLRRRRSDDFRPDLAEVPLVFEGLTKSYPGGLKAVDDLSFRVERGQVLGLLGPNGAGKTTALRMLMGLIWPDDGVIRVFGQRVEPGAPVLSRVGSFIEGPGALPHLPGLDNLRLYWAATGRPAKDSRIDEALRVAGLGTAIHRRVSTYSHGMKQRLAIAQAMLGMPDLLVLDEPTNGLDPPQIREMREVLHRYAATGRTVVVSSHLLAEVEQTCSHVVVMHRGKLIAAGEVNDIVAGGGQATFRVDSPDAAAAALRAAVGIREVEVDGPLVHASLDGLPRSSAVAALVAAGIAVEQVGPRRRLEDAFLQLIGEEPLAGSSARAEERTP